MTAYYKVIHDHVETLSSEAFLLARFSSSPSTAQHTGWLPVMPSPATGPLHILFPRQKRSPPLFSSNWHLFTQSISAQMITTLGKPHRLPSAPPPHPSPLFSMAASLPLLFHHSTATQPRIYLCDDQIPNHLSHCHSTDSLLLLLLSRFSRVPLCETPQAPPSLGFSRQEH